MKPTDHDERFDAALGRVARQMEKLDAMHGNHPQRLTPLEWLNLVQQDRIITALERIAATKS